MKYTIAALLMISLTQGVKLSQRSTIQNSVNSAIKAKFDEGFDEDAAEIDNYDDALNSEELNTCENCEGEGCK